MSIPDPTEVVEPSLLLLLQAAGAASTAFPRTGCTSCLIGGQSVAVIAFPLAPDWVRVSLQGGTPFSAVCFAFLVPFLDLFLALFFLDLAACCPSHFSKACSFGRRGGRLLLLRVACLAFCVGTADMAVFCMADVFFNATLSLGRAVAFMAFRVEAAVIMAAFFMADVFFIATFFMGRAMTAGMTSRQGGLDLDAEGELSSPWFVLEPNAGSWRRQWEEGGW